MKRSKSPADTPKPASVSTSSATPWPGTWIFGLLLIPTFIAYLPALGGSLLWDDVGHVTAPALTSWDGLLRIWFEPGATQQYYPLLHTAFWLEHQLWGDATVGYHLINVVWHALAATLFAVGLRRLAVPGALLAGAVFALHPVAVESVAWISEQKNTLSTVFYLAAALAWFRYEEDRRPARYVIATLWFVAALLTKTVTATLPAALLVLAWWRRGRISGRSEALPLALWLVLGVVAGLGTAWMEATQIGASGGEFTLSAVERGLLAGRVGWFYLGKLVWPFGLTFFYPRWTIDAAVWWQWLFPIATLAALAFGGWWARRRDRGPLAAALLFGGTLFPVLGFVNVYPFIFSYVADHFQYLASLAIIAFLSAASVSLARRFGWSPVKRIAAACAVLGLLGVLTWRQSGTYRDVATLYETTLARNPESWVAHLNYGTWLDDAGRPTEALPHLQRANELKPDYPETLNSLASVLNLLGHSEEARPLAERALQLKPRFAAAHNTLGVALMALRREAEGVAAFEQAVAIDPMLGRARVNLGWAHANGGRLDAAVAQFQEAQRQQPDSADLESKWGLAYVMHNRVRDALPHFARAVELAPDAVQTRFAWAVALMQTGRRVEAIGQFEEVLARAPDHPGAQQALLSLGALR